MAIICLACGAMVYQEHIRSYPSQPSASDIKHSLKNCMKRHFKLPSISNWPLLLSLLIIYIAIVANFQTLPISIGGFVVSIIIYHLIGFCLQKFHQMQSKQETQSCDFVSFLYSNQNI